MTYATVLARSLAGSQQSMVIKVPNLAVKKGLVKVIAGDAAGNSGEDTSDGTFKVKKQ